MRDSRAWLVPVAAVCVAPLVTWLPMLALRAPSLGLPAYHPAQGIDLWQAQVFWFMALTVIGAFVALRDRFLGYAVILVGFLIFWRGAKLDPTHSAMFALGALALAAVRQTPAHHRRRVLGVLAVLGTFQGAYVLQQHFLKYDVLWGPLVGGTLTPVVRPLGTLGTVDATAAYIAITASLLPWWLLPLPIVAVWVSQSMGATAALGASLLLRHYLTQTRPTQVLYGPPAMWDWRYSLTAMALGMVGAGWYFLTYVKTMNKVWPRVAVWSLGLWDAAHVDPFLGYGLGGWAQRIPQLQVRIGSPTGELWREAHSEPIQWVCELGLVGLALLAGWAWTHRRMFLHPQLGPSLTAGAITSLSFFTMHTVATALLLVTLIGLATPDEPLPAGGA